MSAGADSEPFENGGQDFVFPHRLPGADVIARRITAYPWMDSLTVSLALEGVGQLHLGQRSHSDPLAISLSTTDAVGHAFGPDSREIHDQLLRVNLWRRLLPPDFGWLICVSTRPGYIWSNGALGAEHGAGNPEDVEVPIAFLGPGIRAQHVARPVRSIDIAPTLARLLMVRPTEPLDGVVLPEVVSP